MALMAMTNLIAICLLAKPAFTALTDYMAQRKTGAEPVFKAETIENQRGIQVWKD